jgi:hypothetical protein
MGSKHFRHDGSVPGKYPDEAGVFSLDAGTKSESQKKWSKRMRYAGTEREGRGRMLVR